MGMGGNMQQLARQAQKLQKQMADTQEALEAREYEATSGGGMVTRPDAELFYGAACKNVKFFTIRNCFKFSRGKNV